MDKSLARAGKRTQNPRKKGRRSALGTRWLCALGIVAGWITVLQEEPMRCVSCGAELFAIELCRSFGQCNPCWLKGQPAVAQVAGESVRAGGYLRDENSPSVSRPEDGWSLETPAEADARINAARAGLLRR